MPRKASFKREDFTNTAFAIAKELGLSAVTAREIANRLECSTRPMFTYFDSVDELRGTVTEKAIALFREKLSINGDLTALGSSMISFSIADPGLWNIIVSSETLAGLIPELTPAVAQFNRLNAGQADHALKMLLCAIPSLSRLPEDEAYRMTKQLAFAELKALRETPGYLNGDFNLQERRSRFESWID